MQLMESYFVEHRTETDDWTRSKVCRVYHSQEAAEKAITNGGVPDHQYRICRFTLVEVVKEFPKEYLQSQEVYYVDFGDISRSRLQNQCQYGSRYVDGRIEGYPNLGEGLRFLGNTNDYHSLKIHSADVQEFVERYINYRESTSEPF